MTSPNGHGGHVTVEGTVEARNERGLKLDGEWINLSKFRKLDLPDAGARVRAEVDQRGYLCAIDVLGSDSSESKTPDVLSDDLLLLSTRLAVLKAAAEFVGLWGQTRPEVKSEHVLTIADKWLAWVMHDDR
jgi:hypothetical protein